MSDFSARLIYSPCLHHHIVVEITGTRCFRAGQVKDDIQERLRCLDCFGILDETEIRAAWGEEIEEPENFQVGNSHGNDHCDSQ